MTTATDTAPAPGQLVTVRNRRWVVADVARSDVASGDPHMFTGQAPHLATLVSIEDDARDEELRVVWELEPGRRVHDSATLPDPRYGFDDPGQLELAQIGQVGTLGYEAGTGIHDHEGAYAS